MKYEILIMTMKFFFFKFSYNNKYNNHVSKLSFLLEVKVNIYLYNNLYLYKYNLTIDLLLSLLSKICQIFAAMRVLIFRCVKRDLLLTNGRIRMIECQQIDMIGIANLNSYKKI